MLRLCLQGNFRLNATSGAVSVRNRTQASETNAARGSTTHQDRAWPHDGCRSPGEPCPRPNAGPIVIVPPESTPHMEGES